MKIDVKVHSIIHFWKISDRIADDKTFWKFAATEWHRLYEDYVPYRSGQLYKNVRIEPGKITHVVPYAHRNYVGRFNFRQNQHPRASRMWDKAAEPTQKPKLIASLQAYIDKGRIKLNG